MCKLAGWTSSKSNPLTKAAADAALAAAHEVIIRSEKDGFGFAQYGTRGLRGQFLDPSSFDSMDSLPTLRKRAGKAMSAFAASKQANQEGTYVNNRHMIVHGRTATCGVSLENVHPFRRRGWTLAHNGVIDWAGQQTADHKNVTCDSQHLLICMADHTPMLQRKEAIENITGYAAFMALSPQGKLVVAVDNRASLYAGITSKGRWIFGTTPIIVDAIADAWNAKQVTPFAVDDWVWMEFDPSSHTPDVSHWKHAEATQKQLGYSQRSLGYSSYGYSNYGSYRSPYAAGSYASSASKPGILTAAEATQQRLDLEEEERLDMQAQDALDMTPQLDTFPDYEPSK